MAVNKNHRQGVSRVAISALVAGLALSFALFRVTSEWEREKIAAEFHLHAEDRTDLLKDKSEDLVEALHVISALYESSEEIERDEFHIFVQGLLSKNPYIFEIEWLPRVRDTERLLYEEAAQRDGLSGFFISEPDEDGRFIRSGKREEYFPVYYSESSNDAAGTISGFDVSTNPARRAAIEKARDTGSPVATGRLRLIRRPGEGFALRVFLPIYRNGRPHESVEERRANLAGFVSALIYIPDFVEIALNKVRSEGVNIYIYDRSSGRGEQFIYFHRSRITKDNIPPPPGDPEELKRRSGFAKELIIYLADREWSVSCLPTSEFISAHRRWASWLVLFVGVLLSLLLAVYLSGVLTRTAKVETLIKERTSELQRSEEKYRALFDFNSSILKIIPFGMDIVDEDCNILYINDKFESMFGKEAIGKKCWSLYKDNWVQCEECPLKGGIEVGEMRNAEADGVLGGKTFQIIHTGVIFNGKKSVMEIFIDITERKEVERLKDEFVSTVSHELRTPLSITKEGISLVLDGIPGEINEKQSNILTVAKSNIDRLARIIDSLLDISKIESGKVGLRKSLTDIGALIKQVVASFEPAVKKKGLDIRTDLPEGAMRSNVDTDSIVQVLTNLLSNAVKFTEKGHIVIAAGISDNEVRCSVADTGIGIAGENMPKLFNKFQQFGRTAGRGEKGTGLGLSIAKRIIEMHNGKMWAESEPGKGTKFTFTLPLGQ
ncbi:MAG: CHASE domain-containing protein [Candidatus Omnitrophota bacterium]